MCDHHHRTGTPHRSDKSPQPTTTVPCTRTHTQIGRPGRQGPVLPHLHACLLHPHPAAHLLLQGPFLSPCRPPLRDWLRMMHRRTEIARGKGNTHKPLSPQTPQTRKRRHRTGTGKPSSISCPCGASPCWMEELLSSIRSRERPSPSAY